jgi:hypothetical protein
LRLTHRGGGELVKSLQRRLLAEHSYNALGRSGIQYSLHYVASKRMRGSTV